MQDSARYVNHCCSFCGWDWDFYISIILNAALLLATECLYTVVHLLVQCTVNAYFSFSINLPCEVRCIWTLRRRISMSVCHVWPWETTYRGTVACDITLFCWEQEKKKREITIAVTYTESNVFITDSESMFRALNEGRFYKCAPCNHCGSNIYLSHFASCIEICCCVYLNRWPCESMLC